MVFLSDRFTLHFGEVTASLMLARRPLLVLGSAEDSRESLASSAFSEAISWSLATSLCAASSRDLALRGDQCG